MARLDRRHKWDIVPDPTNADYSLATCRACGKLEREPTTEAITRWFQEGVTAAIPHAIYDLMSPNPLFTWRFHGH